MLGSGWHLPQSGMGKQHNHTCKYPPQTAAGALSLLSGKGRRAVMALLFYGAAAAAVALVLGSPLRPEAACLLAFGVQWPDQALAPRHDADYGGAAAAAAGHARFRHASSALPS